LDALIREFGSEVKSAADALTPVEVKLHDFKLEDAKDKEGTMVCDHRGIGCAIASSVLSQ